MSLSDKIRKQVLSSFRAELAEHIQTMTDGLLALEQGNLDAEARQPMLEEIFRAAHSLKGAARAVGVSAIEQLAHQLETILDAIRHNAIELAPALFTACYQAMDAIQAVQAAYESGETTPPGDMMKAMAALGQVASTIRSPAPAKDKPPTPVSTPTPPPTETVETPLTTETATEPAVISAAVPETTPTGDETIRVSVSKLDALMAQLSELLVTKIRADQRLVQVRQLQEAMALWQKEWLAIRTPYSRLTRQQNNGNGTGDMDKDIARLLEYITDNQRRMQDVGTQINEISRQHANDTMHMTLVIDELEQEIKRARMLPLATITSTFGRMVRDLSYEANKEARLQISGSETELDKRVLEQIKDPLTHLLRNAIDHGLETPDERIAAGKPERGLIELTAQQQGQDVVIQVTDDGSGIDMETLRQAVSRHTGIDASTLSQTELTEAMFNAGVSTSPIITDISGRGVGLDVVRRNIEALQGRIAVTSIPGKGTTFALTLPLTLTSSRALLVSAASESFAIPLNTIERIMSVDSEEITSVEGQDTIYYEGNPVTLTWLNEVLELPQTELRKDDHILVVILAAAERRMAFAVDQLVGEQEVVIKNLGKQLARVGGITGATVMGSGEVVLILNVTDLIKLALRGGHRSMIDTLTGKMSAEQARIRRRILVVDDSITTRTLEKNILTAAGYTVQIANDGQEALDAIAAEGLPDLIVTDIEMPNLDGFELTQRLKQSSETSHIPIILVTSLDAPSHKSRGISVGADAYIVKSSFDQRNLLETIEQLI